MRLSKIKENIAPRRALLKVRGGIKMSVSACLLRVIK